MLAMEDIMVSEALTAIAVGFVASMAIGFVLFARPVLGNTWMRLVGLDPANIPKDAAMKSVMGAAVLALVLNVGFAIVVDITSADGAGDGVTLGFLLFLFFAVPLVTVHTLFEMRPAAVAAIYGLNHFIEFVVLGVIHTSL